MTGRLPLLTALFAVALAGTASAAPVVTPTIFGTLGTGGWYTGPVTVNWSVTDPDNLPITSQTPGCLAATFSSDTPSATQTCTAASLGGSTTVTTRAFKIDQTPPGAISAATSRAADHAGWFTSPVGITWTGSDAMSGLASCTAASYAGPDAPSASLSGTCRDAAGNTSPPFTVTLAYDATPPSLSDVTASPGDTTASLAWKPSADTKSVSIVATAAGAAPRPVYEGPGTSFLDTGLTNGRAYSYKVTAFDAAGNAASQSASATPFSMLVAPPPNARINSRRAKANPPTLNWTPRSRASYYNVQIFRRVGGKWRKVMSRWPRTNRMTMPLAWSFRGKRYELDAARYRWYVWPGYGPKRLHRYGKLLGKRDFVITPE
jgi:hypothetical protein